jgi:hypothetical protein
MPLLGNKIVDLRAVGGFWCMKIALGGVSRGGGFMAHRIDKNALSREEEGVE